MVSGISEAKNGCQSALQLRPGTPGPWSTGLRGAKGRPPPVVRAPQRGGSRGGFLAGLLGPERRKDGLDVRGEAAGDPGPWRQQAVPGHGRRDAEALCDLVGQLPRHSV